MALGEAPSMACQTFLMGSERAQAQWELEGRFRTFESRQ
jgi:adenosine deaminase